MTIKETFWLVFALSIICHIVLYFWLPVLKAKHIESKEYKKRLLEDNVELARMIQQQGTRKQ